jgi:hypothetical protein
MTDPAAFQVLGCSRVDVLEKCSTESVPEALSEGRIVPAEVLRRGRLNEQTMTLQPLTENFSRLKRLLT